MIKKEAYCTDINLDENSRLTLKNLEDYTKHTNCEFELSASALLILDMQNYFLNEISHAFIPSAPAIVEPINNLIKFYSERKLPVILTRHSNTADNAGMMANWWKYLINSDSEDSKIFGGIHSGNSTIVDKHQYDAFYQTELLDLLKQFNVRQLVISGVVTHLCYESTIRSAFTNNFAVFMPIDATADYNYDMYFSSLKTLCHGFAIPTLSMDIINGNI